MGASASGFHDGKCVTSTGTTPCHRSARNSDSSKTFSSMHSGDQLVGVSVREKKKKMTGFATLRRKLIRRRRTSKSYDHGKVIREFVSDWSPLELNTLVEEYEATAALKDLSVQADLARPPASTHKQDLSDLFDYKYASDVTLIFQGACFPVHRAILSSRCSYFRELLASGASGNNTRTVHGAQVHVDSLLQSRGIDVPTFAALLRYLYTGDFCLLDGVGDTTSQTDLDVLIRLGQEFGTPNQLEHDLRYLMDTGDLADAVLVFASGQDFALATGKPHCSNSSLGSSTTGNIGSSSSDYGFYPRMEMRCHRAILSARSPFFRSLIQRRCRTTENAVTPTRIILDESVIPRRYAHVLMQALYLDTVDMNCIVRSGCNESSSSSTTEETPNSTSGASGGLPAATTTGLPVPRPAPPTLFEEATELYQIGRFLELDILSQGCEDVIVDNLSLDNLPQVLRWSELPHGSPWVRRQALQLLREEFSPIAQAPVLLELDKSHLIEALQSDFLQASELEVLQAVLRWGEHQLVRRMEDREPNIVSQTAHSVARKGVRRRDLNDVELRDILSELLPHVRVDHVLPPSHESLAQAIRRGLVSTPPSHMIGGDNSHKLSVGGGPGGGRGALSAWIRGHHHHHHHHTAKHHHHTGLYVKPRLFMPYFEETKSLLADQLVQEMELVRHRMVRMSSHIPDTLYMIDDAPAGLEASSQMATSSSSATSDLDVVTGAVPVPDSETLQAMIRRERKLRLSPLAQRAYSLQLASRRDINRQIRLRVVREFNLPDSIAEELESAAYQFAEEADESQQQQQIQATSALIWEPRKSSSVRVPVPPKRMTSRPKPFQKSEPALDFDDDDHQLHQSQLSEFIPDIAALSINPLPQFVPSLQPPEPYRELQLDLGDGASISRLSSVEWSIVRSSNPSMAPPASNPIRMSTFRSDDDWAEQQAERPSAATLGGAAAAIAASTGSPRTQRRSRSGRAADVRVFI
ncbi:BTB/POZ domain-containing protein 7-like isoform X1 [Daphnia pulicaria]|uniref:BTB/POZ domain-containing protein 7-like isoform X1 n=1 Tax=Daphnia pulicaria TaxID=35523 RepID=UPI001EEA880D|nr:BTB/POZ domain-containing protein 7-like isoform X1 [Daphnia pulicaria]